MHGEILDAVFACCPGLFPDMFVICDMFQLLVQWACYTLHIEKQSPGCTGQAGAWLGVQILPCKPPKAPSNLCMVTFTVLALIFSNILPRCLPATGTMIHKGSL